MIGYDDLEIDLRYVVVKPSVNGEFQIGDHIKLLPDGAVLNLEAGGWIDMPYLSQATEGMVVEIDKEWLSEEKEKLKQRLKELENV
jgi:hypothetical protein